MELPKDVNDAIDDIVKNYTWSKNELRIIYLFLQTLAEYKKVVEK
jgi:hypothetical protein